tara:strand:+ start:2220 stop:2375 length:156 start_codon:yes stop_codon:yes gene_type:complete
MKFSKQQLELIAYSVSLLESDGDNEFSSNTNLEMQQILGKLQEVGIWGNVE